MVRNSLNDSKSLFPQAMRDKVVGGVAKKAPDFAALPCCPSGKTPPVSTDCQPLPAKIFHFIEIRIYRMYRPSRFTKRGDRTSSLIANRVAVDAAASGARWRGQGG